MDVIDTADKVTFSAEKMQKISLFSTDDALVDLYCVRPTSSRRSTATWTSTSSTM